MAVYRVGTPPVTTALPGDGLLLERRQPTQSSGGVPLDENAAVTDIWEYMRREFERIEATFNESDFLKLKELNEEPIRPRDGLTVLADGTNWNPGSGQGVYTYYAGSWKKLG